MTAKRKLSSGINTTLTCDHIITDQALTPFFIYNRKRGDLRCVIGCGGFTGLSKSGKWSSWSTGQTILPDTDEGLPELFARLRDDPANAAAKRNITF